MYGGISDPGMVHCRPRVALAFFSSPGQSAIGRRGWGFHTVRGGSDPEGQLPPRAPRPLIVRGRAEGDL